MNEEELETENETVELERQRYLELIDESQTVKEVKQILDESTYESADIGSTKPVSETPVESEQERYDLGEGDRLRNPDQDASSKRHKNIQEYTERYESDIQTFRKFSLLTGISSLGVLISGISLSSLGVIPIAVLIILTCILLPTSVLFLKLWRGLDD